MVKFDLTQIIIFGMVGLSNTIIAYLIYSLFILLGFHYLIANFVSFLVSVLNAYYWNNKYVFKTQKGEYRSCVRSLVKTYVAYGSTGLILQSFLLYLLVDILHISEYIAQILCLMVTIPLNYLINKYWSFKTNKI